MFLNDILNTTLNTVLGNRKKPCQVVCDDVMYTQYPDCRIVGKNKQGDIVFQTECDEMFSETKLQEYVQTLTAYR